MYLKRTQITGEGLKDLAGLTGLETISLEGALIGDDGIERLTQLSSLRHLYLADTQMTAAGLKNLEKAMPACSIHR